MPTRPSLWDQTSSSGPLTTWSVLFLPPRSEYGYQRHSKQPGRSECVRCCDPPATHPMYYPMPQINMTILKGEKGDRGDRGFHGKLGKAGAAGKKGEMGFKGQKGNMGSPGESYKTNYAAFSVGRRKPLHSNDYYQILVFDTEFVNLYGHFNMFMGKFYCYVPGIYFFSLNVHTWNQKETYLHIMHNTKEAAILYAQASDRSIMQSQSLMIELQDQDEIWIRLFKGERDNAVFSDEYDTYVTFSGYLRICYHGGPEENNNNTSTPLPLWSQLQAFKFINTFQHVVVGNQNTSLLETVTSELLFPARQYDRHTTEPISFYLSGLEELLAWKPTKDDAFNVSTEPLAKRQPPLESHRPRTLVCHDMKGGYLEDRFIQGAKVRDPYVFYHWCYIDIFVYFSHHLVTIPPVVWTNAAHRNGVLMLGTFITEWMEGEKTCESFLAGEEEAYLAVAKQLAAIAEFYHFDGWLINIENTLSALAAQKMPHFLQHLTAEVHRLVPGGQVLWYDSVLKNGELKWQNELNELNKVYFDACDGFFTNYNWKEAHLLQTREVASSRQADVYVGVDVFGRGDVVSSGFDIKKSLQMIREQGLSVAIFAPGWVYEHLGPRDFLNNEDKFWALLSQLLSIHRIVSLPFCTSFSLGVGNRHFSYGQETRTEPWYNLSAQEIQPIYGSHRMSDRGWVKTRSCLQEAWYGGSCLLLEGAISPKADHITARLFSFQMPAPSRLFLVLIFKHKSHFHDMALAPLLTTRESWSHPDRGASTLSGEPTRHTPSLLHTPPPDLARLLRGCEQRGEHGWQNRTMHVDDGKKGRKVSLCAWLAEALWTVRMDLVIARQPLSHLSHYSLARCYELELQNCFLDELSLTVSRRQPGQEEMPFACRLGKIWVLDAASLHSLSTPNATSSMLPMDASHVHWHRPSARQLSVSLTLSWTYPPSRATCFRVHHRSGSCVRDSEPPLLLLGEAHACLYRVTQLAVPNPETLSSCRLEFLVEPVPNNGSHIDPA
ncbi:Cytosolic endo-beta-N-acetylglucosaminidase, partial [Ophiophagus hannah]